MHDHNEKFFDDEPLPPGYHRHSDGTVHTHAHLEDGSIPPEHLHSHEHDHSHGHTHTQTKAVLNRLSRAIGHLESVRTMVETGRDCTEVLIQLAAVRSALSSTAKVILKDHMEHCISEDGVDAEEQMRALNEAIDKFM
ncbi:MAG: metal-sensing transcriptional repressor [Oscillospiraceae bacterium]|nr:metal-sensing transcriptional repressor [Oscillospiraceae bacterium]